MRGAAESCDLSVRLHVTIHESNLYHQNVSLKKKHLHHPELESQRLDFARLRFVR